MISISADRDAFLALGPPADIDRLRYVESQQLFVAARDGRPVARCAARLRDEIGTIGFFEAEDDRDAVAQLLGEASAWLRARGAERVIGPMNGDTWHNYRINAGPFDVPPFFLEPFNPPWYDALWRFAGFEIVDRYSSKRVEDVTRLVEKLEPMHTRAALRGYRIRPVDRSRLQEELTLVWRMSIEIYRENAWYSDVSFREFFILYRDIDLLLVPDLFLFAEAPSGEPAALLFAYPDTDERIVNYRTVGVMPKHRNGYLGWALLYRAYSAALAMKRPIANHCLMHEGAAAQSMDGGEGVVFRRYYLYEAKPSS